jgi:hypothetical protein
MKAAKFSAMRAFLFLCFLTLATISFGQSPTATATSPPDTSPTPDSLPNIWRCDLPSGTYEVALRAIVSVSRHEYIVDGVARVAEVNVDTQGNMAVRFYYIEPNLPKAPSGVGQSALDRLSDLAKEAAQRTGQEEIWKRVVKSYPTTTHTHTVEYRVASDEQLKKIFTSAQNAFETGRGATLKVD